MKTWLPHFSLFYGWIFIKFCVRGVYVLRASFSPIEIKLMKISSKLQRFSFSFIRVRHIARRLVGFRLKRPARFIIGNTTIDHRIRSNRYMFLLHTPCARLKRKSQVVYRSLRSIIWIDPLLVSVRRYT